MQEAERTRTIFVSSSSCWTFMIVSACLGSWYLRTASASLVSPTALDHDSDVKSSSSFWRSEKVTREG
jgi:hypothetical protein